MPHYATSPVDARQQQRDEVMYRARARCPAGLPLALVVVNTSVGGLMARSHAQHRVGDRLQVTLPVIGEMGAEVRWALGGRIGCRFDRIVSSADYYALLTTLRR